MARAKRALVFTRNCSEKRGIFFEWKKQRKKIHAQKIVTLAGYLKTSLKKIIMKKYILAAGLALGSVGIIATTMQSCMTIATTVGLSVLKKILIGGVSKGL